MCIYIYIYVYIVFIITSSLCLATSGKCQRWLARPVRPYES